MAQVPILTIPLASNATPTLGSATSAFSRSFAAAYLSSLPDIWGDAPTQTPGYGVYGYNSGSSVTSLFSAPESRDLTDADWVKTNCTAAKNDNGLTNIANAASRLTATSNNGTCLRSFTASATTRTFSAWLKRVSGTGTVEITVNGGTNWTDVTSQINSSTWTRVTLSATGVTNPSVGFRLGTSGDVIAADGIAIVASAVAGYPLLARSESRETETLSWSSVTSPVAGKRYYMQAKIRWNKSIGNTLTLSYGNSNYAQNAALIQIAADGANVIAAGNLFASSSNVANINQSTSTALGKALAGLTEGQEYTIGIEFGMRQACVTVNGVRYSADFGVGNASWLTNPDFTAFTNMRINNTGWINSIEVGERTVDHYLLAGDSITSNANYLLTFVNLSPSLNRIWNNRGISGNKTTDLQARLATDVTPFCFADALSNNVVLWIGTNDIADNKSAATTLADLQTLVNTILGDASWTRIFLVNCMHRTSFFANGATSSSHNTQRAILNAGLSSISGVVGVVDVASLPELSDSTNTTYFIDGTHLTQAGYNVAVPVILEMIDNPPAITGSGRQEKLRRRRKMAALHGLLPIRLQRG